MATSRCDLLCFGPHPDDAEIALGGTLRLLADRGRRIWVCDLTRGELSTNGDPETRWTEAMAAADVLGLAGRLQLALPDGFLTEATRDHVLPVVHVLRRLCPAWVLTACGASRHPDHLAVAALIRRAAYLARLRALAVPEPPARWWPDPVAPPTEEAWVCSVVADACPQDTVPDLLFDITDTWKSKRRALACYRSQFQRREGCSPTAINDPSFLAEVDAAALRWGRRAGIERAEALKLDMRPVLDDLPQGRWA